VTEAVWRLQQVDGVRLLRCIAIEAIPRVAHAFSTRIAFGRADFDLGSPGSDAPDPRSRTASFFRAAGLGDAQPALLRQVHGGIVVDASTGFAPPPAADGAIRVARHGAATPVPAVRTADCVAVLVADRHATAVAALHAGWRGVAAGIASNAVLRFATEGVDSRDLVVALGPAILGCCYEVGEDVVTALDAVCGARAAYVERTASGRVSVDLHAALRQQLVAAGVPTASIHSAPWCTRCRTDLFFSFRGEGPGTGRLMAAVGPAAGP
jgi:hypothetical protein